MKDDLRERVAKEIFSHHFTPDESELDWYWNHKQWKQERDDCMAEADAILALVAEDRAALVAEVECCSRDS